MRRTPFCLLVSLALAGVGCSSISTVQLAGKPVSASRPARSPRIAWDGTHYAIAFLRPLSPQRFAVDAVLLDPAGKVVRSVENVEQVDHLSAEADEFLLSDLVWNPSARQFAFVAAREGAAFLVLLDPQLDVVGGARIALPDPPATPPKLADLSLAWNPVRGHYAVATVAREVTSTGRQSDVYLSFVRPDGSFSDPRGAGAGSALYHAVDCPLNCRRTSLAVTADGAYRLAYFKTQDDGSVQPTLGYLDESLGFGKHGAVRERLVLQAYAGTFGAGLRLTADPAGDGVLVAATQDGGTSPDAGLWLQAATLTFLQPPFSLPGGHDRAFGLSPLAPHRFVVCFGDGQVRCRPATEQYLLDEVVTPPAGAPPRSAPSQVMGPKGLELAWIEGNAVYFGPVYR